MKIVINNCYGIFDLSDEAERLYYNRTQQKPPYDFDDRCRTCSVLIKIVETLGKRASGPYSDLKIVEIPDSATDFYIDEYDGIEEVIYVIDGKIKFKGVYDDG